MGLRYQFDITFGKIPHRKYISVLAMIGLTINYVMRFSVSIIMTEMVKHQSVKIDPDGCHAVEPKTPEHHDHSNKLEWTEFQQGIALSSFFWGYILTLVPGGMIADHMGARRLLVLSSLLTSLFTLVSPLAIHEGGLWAFVVVRILLGLCQGCFYASLHTVVARWVPTQERSFWGSLVFTGAHLGNFLQNLCSGYMLFTFRPHWEYVFYIWGICGASWSIMFFLTTWDSYLLLPTVTDDEKAILDAYYEKVNKKAKVEAVPWKDILTSWCVWAMIVAMIGHDWGLFALVTDIPKYMQSVLRFNVKANGAYVASGYLALCAVSFGSAWVAGFLERKEILSTTNNRKILYTISSVGPSLGLLATSYARCNRAAAVAFLVIGMSLMGTFYPSLKVNPIDLSPNHAGVLGAMMHCIGSISGILVPFLIGIMTPDSTWSQWNGVWWLSFVVMSATNVFYYMFASGDLQPWNSYGLKETT